LQAELTQLRTSAERTQRQTEIDRRIAEAALPSVLNTEVFREQCYAAESEAALARVIHARQQDARLLSSQGKPRSIEQNQERWPEKPVGNAAAFAAALR